MAGRGAGAVCHLRGHPRSTSFGVTALKMEGARFLGRFCQASRSAERGNVAPSQCKYEHGGGGQDGSPRFRCPNETAWLISHVLTNLPGLSLLLQSSSGLGARGARARGQAGIRVQTPKCRSEHAGGWDLTQTLQKSQDQRPDFGRGAFSVDEGGSGTGRKGACVPRSQKNCCQAWKRGY